MEQLEAEQIERFAQQKEQQLAERKKRVEERFKSKLKARQEIIDRQAAHLQALKEAAVERELKQMRDLEREKDLKEQRDAEKRKTFWGEIVRSRTAQLERKDRDDEKKKTELDRMRNVWQKRAVELIDEEVQDRLQAKSSAVDVQRFQLLQAQEREMQKAKDKEQRHLEALMVKKAMQDDDDMFKGYVNAVMSEYVKAGKSSAVRSKLQSTTS